MTITRLGVWIRDLTVRYVEVDHASKSWTKPTDLKYVGDPSRLLPFIVGLEGPPPPS